MVEFQVDVPGTYIPGGSCRLERGLVGYLIVEERNNRRYFRERCGRTII